MTRQRELARREARARFWSRTTRALVAAGVGFGGAAIAADWTGHGRLSGPLAIGALGALLLAFVVASLPVRAENPAEEDLMPGAGQGAAADGD